MTPRPTDSGVSANDLTNGSGAAAILSAGIGCFVLAVIAIAADKSASIKQALNLYTPSGPLSGVSALAIVAWLVIWLALEIRWRKRTVDLKAINTIAFILLGLSVLLTFPPIADLF